MMSKRITGGLFCLASSVLFTAGYLAAALRVSFPSAGYNTTLFLRALSFVGIPPFLLSLLCLIVGVSYLISAELDARKHRDNPN